MISNKILTQTTPILLILAFTGFFTGKNPHYVSGLSPFFYDLARVETIVFGKAKSSRRAQERDYGDQVRNRIEKVISSYHTGLDEKMMFELRNGYSRQAKNMVMILFF